jgi:hypothetical protein
MNYFFFSAGLLLFIISLADVAFTSFSARGAGFITAYTTKKLWRFCVQLCEQLKNNYFLRFAGVLTVCVTLLQWILLLWTSAFIMTLSDDSSIINGQTKLPAGLLDKIYVTGYSLSTMGNGDFEGGSELWRIYLAVLSISGMVVVTVSLTYLIQVLEGVTTKRALSNSISSLGTTPEKLLLHAWNGKDFSSLNMPLFLLEGQITALAEKHLSYPVLHYYYSEKRSKSLPINLAILDEAMTILHGIIPPEYCTNQLAIRTIRGSISSFLQTLKSNLISKAEEEPPIPSLAILIANNVSVNRQRVPLAFSENKERRMLLLGLLKDDARKWQTVYEK